jgi:hypothetical protein
MKPFVVAAAVTFAVVSLYPATPLPNAAKVLIAGGESPDLFLLYTGDVIGNVDPCG